MIFWFSVAAKKASQSVNLFSLSIPAMCLPGIQDEFSAKSIVCFQSGVLCLSCIISMGASVIFNGFGIFWGEVLGGVWGEGCGIGSILVWRGCWVNCIIFLEEWI